MNSYEEGMIIETIIGSKCLITRVITNGNGQPLDRYYVLYDDGSCGELDEDIIEKDTGKRIDVKEILGKIN